ncbi:unnamed protein product, partial [Iphiclides podalirius]
MLKETEKSTLSKTFHSVTYPLFTSILHLCVAGSIKGKAYIKCDKIMEACQFVLNNKRLNNTVGDAYLTLLYKYVLCSENYPKYITSSVWEDLLDIATKACISSDSYLDDFVRLKLLWLVIKNAGECTQFSLTLRNSLNKMTQYFHKLVNNKKALEVVTDIMILTLDMLYLESRLSVCQFAEKNLPLIFQFYEQNLDLKKKSQLFKLLDISIAIHHPLGRIRKEDAALAYNWDDWNKCLHSIMAIICLETAYIHKSYKQNANMLHQCPFFARVAASTYFVIFKMSAQEKANNCDTEKSSKKPKITLNNLVVFEDLLREFQKSHIAWIDVTHMYVEHFGHFISINEYKILLEILEKLVNNNNIQQISNVFENLTCLVLKNSALQNDIDSNTWKKLVLSLWNACVRNSTSVTTAQKVIHGVMQAILLLNLLEYHNVKPLFILYFEKGMPVNDQSVKTLTMLFKKFYAKSCYNFGRIKCFTWFANGQITNVDRCASKFYPPKVVALVFKCAAKLTMLEYKENNQTELSFKDVLIDNLKANLHCIRLYCSYLINDISEAMSGEDTESCIASLKDMFTVVVSDDNETILKDELRYSLEDLPLYLFIVSEGGDQISMKYMKWFVSADILWRHRGVVQQSAMMQKFKRNIPETEILEKSFSNIIVLSLPYIVSEKYGLISNKEPKLREAASKMFHQTREMLKNEKWTNLFVENMGELVLLTALHLRDHSDAQNVFEIQIPQNFESYNYSKDIFYAIIKYFSELIDGNIMEYLCENQPLAILKVLFVLWENVISENLFEFKVISLHTFVTFIGIIPLGIPSDAVLWVYDPYAVIMTEAVIETYNTEDEVSRKLEKYLKNLSFPSIATISKMRKFLCAHKKLVKNALDKLDGKGFSEECVNSVLHKLIWTLSNILKTSNDDKMIIEVSNCLADVGTYDLKTLVTAPPSDTKQLIDVKPTLYFAFIAVTSLLDIIFDEDPTVSYRVAKALYHLKKFKDGSLCSIDLGMINNQILVCLTPATCESFAQYIVHSISILWVPMINEEHLQWIQRITLSLLAALASSSNYLSSLHSVCNLKPSLCEKILPPLVGLIIENSSEEQIQIIGKQINQVFVDIWDKSFNCNVVNSEDRAVSNITSLLNHNQKVIVHYLLDVINTIRLQRNHSKIRKLREPNALRHMKLEYEKLAWAATLADKNIAAIYYAELWAAAENGGVPPSSPEGTAKLEGGENLQRILRSCFVSIGELDATDGCGTAHLTSELEKRRHLLNTGQYSDALLLHDIALSNGAQEDNSLQHGVVMSLHKSGMHHLALQYIKSFPENDDLDDVKYDCLSYLGDWSEIVDTTELEEKAKQAIWDADVIIKSFRYACLKECLNARPCEAFGVNLMHLLNKAKLATSKLCRILNMENCQSVYKVVANLHLFRDIEDYCSVRCGRTRPSELLDRWQVEKLASHKNFLHLEALLSQRSLILEHAAKQYENMSSDIIDLQLQYVDMALSNQRIQFSQRLLQAVKNFKPTKKVVFVESQIAWEKGHKDIALALLHGVVTEHTPDVKLTAMCLRQYGLWMAESRRENAREIINKYLEKSLEILNRTDHAETTYKVYHDIAKFADAEYKQIVSYMNSTVFENKVKCIESMKGIAASFKVPQDSLTKDERKALTTNDRFMKMDEDEVSRTRLEKESFLNLAMRYYLLSLRHSEETNLSIFRVISLWFDNPCFEFEVGRKAKLQEFLQAVPSWKFITVLPQLAPRITTETSDFAKYLKDILDRCATEHPHHTLPILFNLKNSDKDSCILNASKGAGSSSRAARPHTPEPRVSAADALVRGMARRPLLAPLVQQMERLCDAFISFAYFTPRTNNAKPQPIPAAETLSKLRNLDALPVPTITLSIRKNGGYSNLPTITEFGTHFELVGGINYPKKITCRSSDGKCRILLIKGEDDLRQDAVMQQVFNIVNKLLENNPITNKNKLLVRTYKVVPMSRRSGVLEWCEGTLPLGAYLIEAHMRCRPKDITPSAARTKLKACHDNRKSNQEKLRVFMAILANFKPVFHNFFTEHYHDPITWYERRLAYTRSVATSSMVGYILGLGDRHVQNILIDTKTAEVIHIDLGIAFDQGKALPTPETIPFRLTQDIIAGFGCCGVEGIFRRCCEKTMQLLRDNQETLLTILEVLLCDPLYSWTLKGPLKNSSVYSLREGEPAGSGLAERALLSVGGKLSGAEGGAPGAVSVPGQVARLLHAATDPANLSRLFHGWQPYL